MRWNRQRISKALMPGADVRRHNWSPSSRSRIDVHDKLCESRVPPEAGLGDLRQEQSRPRDDASRVLPASKGINQARLEHHPPIASPPRPGSSIVNVRD